MRKFNPMPAELRERMKTLTGRERKYFMTMWPKSGVLFMTSKPGVAKSAISRSIADKMGFNYIDIRLSMQDETDFKFPYLKDVEVDGKSFKVSGFTIPEWAFRANEAPTIIHFEEMNRAPLFVRNAALQILLERQIGDFKFNDMVLMMASGNLGDEDGTDVEEFDAALDNRLIHFSHSLGADEWIENYAKDNCHKSVVSFIKSYPHYLYQSPSESSNTRAYATPRSWTFISDFIVENFGMDASPSEFLNDLKEVAFGYVGATAQRYLTYLHDMIKIDINDVLDNYDGIADDLGKYNRDKRSELLQSLKELTLSKMTKKQLGNVAKFLKTVAEDELTDFILNVIDNSKDFNDPKVKSFLRDNFKDVILEINRINNNSRS